MISQAAFDSHNKANPPKPNMYTLHRSEDQLYLTLFKIQDKKNFSKSNDSFLSWIGLLAALLFGCQWALGFAAFLFPKFSPEIRALILPFHQVHVQRCSFMQSSILT